MSTYDSALNLDAHMLDVALRNAFKLSERWLALPPLDLRRRRQLSQKLRLRAAAIRSFGT
jgi:hypothetical protein